MTMNRRASLPLVTCIFVLGMSLAVPRLSAALGPGIGFLTVFLIYWFGFCLPLGLVYQGREASKRALSLELNGHAWVPWAVGLQIFLVALANILILPDVVPAFAVIAAVAFALINGPLEEFFWRGAYLEQGQNSPRYQALGVGLFALWHVPLSFSHGVTYHGGTLGLVGGALGLGAFWAFVAYRTGRIGWPILAHVATNVFAISALFVANFR